MTDEERDSARRIRTLHEQAMACKAEVLDDDLDEATRNSAMRSFNDLISHWSRLSQGYMNRYHRYPDLHE